MHLIFYLVIVMDFTQSVVIYSVLQKVTHWDLLQFPQHRKEFKCDVLPMYLLILCAHNELERRNLLCDCVNVLSTPKSPGGVTAMLIA